jgi:flagellar protein FliO/FliZ
MRRRGLLLLAGLALALTASSARADDKALGPFGTQASPAPSAPASGTGAATILGILLLAGAGGYLLLKGRKLQLPSRTVKKLVIDETKSLGSRQFLVVASYEGKKLLLGVCPGRIELITPLDSPPEQTP